MKNPELLVLFQRMEVAILELMQKLGIAPEGPQFGLGQGAPGVPGAPGNAAIKQGQQHPGLLMPGSADPFAFQQMQAQLQMMGNKK